MLATGQWQKITLEDLRSIGEYGRSLAREYPIGTGLMYVAVYTALASTATPGAGYLSIVAGSVFSMWGIVWAWLGNTLGAVGAYLLVRWLIHRDKPYVVPAPASKLAEQLARANPWLVLAMRLSPLVPYNAVNVGAGLVGYPMRSYVLTSMLGMAPYTAMYVLAGTQLREVNRLEDVLRNPLWWVLVFLGAVPPLVLLLQKRRSRVRSVVVDEESLRNEEPLQ